MTADKTLTWMCKYLLPSRPGTLLEKMLCRDEPLQKVWKHPTVAARCCKQSPTAQPVRKLSGFCRLPRRDPPLGVPCSLMCSPQRTGQAPHCS